MGFVSLGKKQIKEIERILTDEFGLSPAKKAAKALRSAGYTSDDLWKFGRTETCQLLPDHWQNNTLNEMRDMDVKERGRL